MVSILSVVTSDKIKLNMVVPNSAAAASFPPLIPDKCFLTVLISSIEAPEAKSPEVTFCFSSKVVPLIGRGINAEPPPDIKTNIRSLHVAFSITASIFFVPSNPFSSGSG